MRMFPVRTQVYTRQQSHATLSIDYPAFQMLENSLRSSYAFMLMNQTSNSDLLLVLQNHDVSGMAFKLLYVALGSSVRTVWLAHHTQQWAMKK